MNDYDTDIIHQCNSGSETLDNEDHSDNNTFFAGLGNRLKGTIANQVYGAKTYGVTTRGFHQNTHFSRQRFVHVDFKNKTLGRNSSR